MDAMKQVTIDDRSTVAELSSGDVLTPLQAWQRFDEAARYYLQLSGEDFIRAWDAGQFDAVPERPEVVHVLMLRPLGR